MEVDKKIEILVNSLNEKGIETIGSCEGHEKGIGNNKGNGYHVPFVVFRCKSKERVQSLLGLISNLKLESNWKIMRHLSQDSYSLTCEKTELFDLLKAHQDIEILAAEVRKIPQE